LLAHGLLDLAQQEPHWTDPVRGGPMRQAVNTMVSHAAMGEAFKVMCWSKGINLDGSTLQHSFLAHDRSGVL
jgi:SAM-dependent MidA family methyltransferase